MKREERRIQILESSRKLFSEKGYYETYVEDVIREAHVGKGTFYRHFENKEELFISLLLYFLNEWEKVAFVNPGDLSAANIDDSFLELIRRSFKFFAGNEDLCNIYLRIGPGLNRMFEQHIEEFENRMLGYIRLYLEEGVKLGRLKRGLNIEMVSNMLAGAFLRVDYYYFVLKKQAGPPDFDAMARDFFDFMMTGIQG
jgi:AcrR family transcriptional regulator